MPKREPDSVIHEPRGFLRHANSARESRTELIPFLQFTTCHIARSHLSRLIGESSNIVPVLEVNWRAAWVSLHCQRLYFARKATFLLPQRGQVTPFGQRRATRYSRQLSGLWKYRMASCRVLGFVSHALIIRAWYRFVNYIVAQIKHERHYSRSETRVVDRKILSISVIVQQRAHLVHRQAVARRSATHDSGNRGWGEGNPETALAA